MVAVTRKKLRIELKELMTPVVRYISTLPDLSKAPEVLKFEHRGENIETHFTIENGCLVVYIISWYGETIAFKVSPEQLGGVKGQEESWIVDRFAGINTLLLNRIYKSLTVIH